MISRRHTLTLFLAALPCPAGPFDKLAAPWHSRITVIRSGRPLYTCPRLTFTAGFLRINAHERAHLWHHQSQ